MLNHALEVNPARAGMILVIVKWFWVDFRKPRTRGDDP